MCGAVSMAKKIAGGTRSPDGQEAGRGLYSGRRSSNLLWTKRRTLAENSLMTLRPHERRVKASGSFSSATPAIIVAQ